MRDLSLAATVVGLLLVGLFVLPFASIWSLNTLFGLAIPYTVKTWAAMVVLLVAVEGGAASSRSKSK